MKYLYTTLLLLLSAVCLQAQEIDYSVEIKREYRPSLMHISKPKLNTAVDDSLYSFHLNFDYVTKSRPYSDLYEFSPVQFFRLSDVGMERYPVFLADFGFSYPTNPYASIYFQPDLRGKKFNFLVYGNHDSEWKKLDGTIADLMKNRLGFAFKHAWSRGEVSFDARYNGDYRTYSGFYSKDAYPDYLFGSRDFMSDNLSAYRNGVSALLGVRSSHAQETSFDYDIRLRYRLTDMDPRIAAHDNVQDHYFSVSGFIGPTFARRHKIEIGFNNETSFYGNGNIYGLAEIKPSYKLHLKRWRFDLGLKVSIPYNGDKKNPDQLGGKRQIVFPDVHLSFNAVNKALLIYLSATGGDRLNTISSNSDRLFWINPVYDVPSISTETFKAVLGFKGSAKDRFHYNIYADYAILNNQLSAVNDAEIIALLNPFYQNYSYAGAGLEMSYRSRCLEFGLDARYRYLHRYENQLILESPFKAGLFGEYTWRDRITARVDLRYEYGQNAGYRAGDEIRYERLDGFFNLGIYIGYRFNPYATIYLQGDNLTNSRQYEFMGYREKGINFGLGMCIKF